MNKAGVSFEEMKAEMLKDDGNYNPSLDFLAKVAESLGKNLSVQTK